jgi:DHA1 family bicyclomycin/chloramphenicol resistance-like MFS transporter
MPKDESAPAVQAKAPLYFVLILAALMGTAPFAVDMYLPALPTIAREFGTTQAGVQNSLSFFFGGFAVGQLFWGPVSDALGRRGPIAAGMALFVVGSAGCALAYSPDSLAFWRIVEAVGGCAAPVLARAIVRDRYGHQEAARMLSLLMLVMSAAPMLAPVIGGQVLVFAAWRTIFWMLGGFGLLLLLALLVLPETLPPVRRQSAAIGPMLRSYLRLLASGRYRAYAFGGAFFYAAMFAYIAGTPFVYIEHFHVSEQYYGILFGLNVVGMMAMNTVNRRLVPKMGADRCLRIGSYLCGGFGVLLAVCGVTGFGGIVGIVLPLLCTISMMGLIGPNSMAGALSVDPRIAGAASALAGSLQFGFGMIAGLLIGWMADGTPSAMVMVIMMMALACCASVLFGGIGRRA